MNEQHGKAVRLAIRSEFLQDGETETLLQAVRGTLCEKSGHGYLRYTEKDGAEVEIEFTEEAGNTALRMERRSTLFRFAQGRGKQAVTVDSAYGSLLFDFFPLSVTLRRDGDAVLREILLRYRLENRPADLCREASVSLRFL